MRIASIFKKLNIKASAPGEGGLPLQPPVLRDPVRVSHGPFRFKAQLAEGIGYEVQATTDLRNWISLFKDTSAGEIEHVDSQASKFSHRFYRLNVNGTLSVNVVGYATVTLPPGFAMIANPLEASDNSVARLFKGMPDGTTLSRFDNRFSRLTENTFKQGKWTKPFEKLVPGEGAVIFNPATDYKSLSFAGDVRQGSFSTPIPVGFSIRSSPVPQPGQLEADLGFPITEGDVIHLFDRDQQKYVLHRFEAAAWSSNPPIVGVGESFWVAKQSPKNWTGSYSIIGGWTCGDKSRLL